ncbi:hypothetical protein MAR_024437 [Mya arenaria]|uniref:Uncharacterized protein n=3 Tax=Mya arenaria TaxID=6604 RepID=A0ABY7DQT1_MYAAR|nr:hypothetical protein MAR_024437 [Mya arenaria]
MTASTSKVRDHVTSLRKNNPDEVEVIENGGLSPQLSVKTDADADDDTCSEIIRIEQEVKDDEGTAVGRIVRTIQVIKAWASGRLRGTRPLPQRPDSFLERVAMGGANESRSHTPERRTRKISDIK